MKQWFIILLFFIINNGYSQTPGIDASDLDSLKKVLFSSENSLEKVRLNAQLSETHGIFLDEWDSVGHYLNRALMTLEEVNDKEEKEEGYLIILEALIAMDVDSFAQVCLFNVKNPQKRARIYLELFDYNYGYPHTDFQGCIANMDSSYYYLNQQPDNNLLAEYYYKVGECHLTDFQLLPALDYFLKAEKIAELDFVFLNRIYALLSEVYFKLKAYPEALEMAEKSKALSEKTMDFYGLVTSINAINDAAFELGQYDLVKAACARAIEIKEQHNYRVEFSLIYKMLGKTAMAEGDLNLAEDYFFKGLNFIRVRNPNTLAACHEGLSTIFFQRNDLEKAKYHATQSIKLFDPKLAPTISNRNQEFAKIFVQTKDYQKAYELVNENLQQREKADSLNNPYDIVSTLLNDNFEQEKSIIEQEKSILENQVALGRQTLLMGLGAAFLLFLTAFFFYHRHRNKTRQAVLQKLVKEQTQEITEQKERLQDLDKFKSRLYTNMTHEFRTPLTVILGMSEQLTTELETLSTKETQKKLSFIRRNGNNLLNLVNQMLDLSKAENNQLAINWVQGDVVAYIKYIAESLNSIATAKQIELLVASQTPTIVMDYDVEKIRQICSNLLSNAIKYSTAGDEVKLNLSTIKNQNAVLDYVRIEVSDTGKGIPKKDLPYIFDRFYQTDDSIAKTGGTGIGLALTRELVQLLEGTIEVTSELEIGTTFVVQLPIHNNASLEQPKSFTLPKENLLPTPTTNPTNLATTALPRLLIIEDNIDVTAYLKSSLEGYYQLSFAPNGQVGIEKALAEIPDLIVSDVMMPQKDGFEVCDTLKNNKRSRHIPIVLLTAKADVESRIAGLNKGADAYLKKPFHQNELLATLNNLHTQSKANIKIQNQQIVKEKLASLGQLTAGVAHEIKNPLNFVTNFAQGSLELQAEMEALLASNRHLLPHEQQEDIAELLDELKQNAAEIKFHGERIDQIVKNMMALARDEKGVEEVVELNQVVDSSAKLAYHGYRAVTPHLNVHFRKNYASNLPVINVFPQSLTRVLINLLNNAFDTIITKQQQTTDYQPQISIQTAKTEQYLSIKIKDNGLGISKANLQQIFNPFFTTKHTQRYNAGLGLSISYDIIVKQHQGQLLVDSGVGDFTVFTILLPLRDGNPS